MAFITRGFTGRKRRDDGDGRLPPGQYLVDDFPVLSAGPTPRTPLERWDFTVEGGVSVDTLLDGVETSADYIVAYCDGGYTTNLPLEDVTDGKAWVVYEYEGEPLDPEHGGPARLMVPHLYFWKSAKWLRGLRLQDEDEPGFWEQLGYHNYGDPWREQRYWGD